MAKRECISDLVEVEHRVFLLRTFVEVVNAAGGDEPADWTMVARHLVRDLERELERLGNALRGRSC